MPVMPVMPMPMMPMPQLMMTPPPEPTPPEPQPAPPPEVIWHPDVQLPGLLATLTAKTVSDGHGNQKPILCDMCQTCQNVKYEKDADTGDVKIASFLCDSCRITLSREFYMPCSGDSPDCTTHRWVDGLGIVSQRCRACDQYAYFHSRGRHHSSQKLADTLAQRMAQDVLAAPVGVARPRRRHGK
jgi:hypothetical protein